MKSAAQQICEILNIFYNEKYTAEQAAKSERDKRKKQGDLPRAGFTTLEQFLQILQEEKRIENLKNELVSRFSRKWSSLKPSLKPKTATVTFEDTKQYGKIARVEQVVDLYLTGKKSRTIFVDILTMKIVKVFFQDFRDRATVSKIKIDVPYIVIRKGIDTYCMWQKEKDAPYIVYKCSLKDLNKVREKSSTSRGIFELDHISYFEKKYVQVDSLGISDIREISAEYIAFPQFGKWEISIGGGGGMVYGTRRSEF